ncbi:MAG: hypothetical protein IJ113_08760 [Eggerthellaceae bacterium]|nr:hypothetical protein [Eggerthellaceae bacterium]
MIKDYRYTQSYPGMTADDSWHEQLEREVVALGEKVLAFIGFGTSVFGAIKSDHGYILVDTGDCPARACFP